MTGGMWSGLPAFEARAGWILIKPVENLAR